jgi:hypothetical protein
MVEPVSFTAEAAVDAPSLDAALARPRVFDAADRVAPDRLDPEDRLEPAPRPRVPAPERPLREPAPAPRELPLREDALLALRELPLALRELPLPPPADAPLAPEPDLEDFVVAADFPFGDELRLVVRALWLVEAMTYLPHRLHLPAPNPSENQKAQFAGASTCSSTRSRCAQTTTCQLTDKLRPVDFQTAHT